MQKERPQIDPNALSFAKYADCQLGKTSRLTCWFSISNAKHLQLKNYIQEMLV